MLEELQREHAVATFFVIGLAREGDPGTVKALYEAGMQIGNHTWTHPQLARLSASKQISELRRTQDEIASIIGVRPRFYRPPYWSWNYLTAREGASSGWSGVSSRSTPGTGRSRARDAIIKAALKAKDGDVIAFHDAGGDRSQTVDAIAPIIVGLRARHLEPVTLDRLYGGRPRTLVRFAHRGVAQLGRALRLGRRGRQFKSARPDSSHVERSRPLAGIEAERG